MSAPDLALPPGVLHRRCDNPGVMTLSGTNSYVVRAEPADAVVVIDPGPADARHREVLLCVVREALAPPVLPGRKADQAGVLVALTHHHDDHEGGAEEFLEALRAEGVEGGLVGGARGRRLSDGERVGSVRAMRAPGHTADSVAFLLPTASDGRSGVLFSGDTVLGEGSSFVADPDGDLTDYLATLTKLAEAVGQGAWQLAPGHGPVGADAAVRIAHYRRHRLERLEEVRAVLAGLDAHEAARDDVALTASIADRVYAGLDEALRPAIEAVVRAQVKHLRRTAR